METMTLNNSSKGKTALSVIGVIVSAVLFFAMIAIIACWVYVRKHPECLPTTASVSYVNDVVDENGNKMSFIEVEYWKNKNNTGTEVFEFILNGNTDWENQKVLTKGVQFVAKDGANDGLKGFKKYCYDKQDGVAWKSVSELDRDTVLFNKLGDDYFAIQLDGSQTYYEEKVTFNSFMKGVGRILVPSMWNKGVKFTESVKHTTYEDLNKMFVTMAQNLSTANVKNGEYKMSLVDLSDYFKLTKYNAQKKQFEDCELQTWNIDYFTCTVRVHEDGLKMASESRFGEVADDNTYISDSYQSESYGTVLAIPTLSVDDFTWEYYDSFRLQLKRDNYVVREYKDVLVPTIKESVLTELLSKGVEEVRINFYMPLLDGYVLHPNTKTVIIFSDFITKVTNKTIKMNVISTECTAKVITAQKGV